MADKPDVEKPEGCVFGDGSQVSRSVEDVRAELDLQMEEMVRSMGGIIIPARQQITEEDFQDCLRSFSPSTQDAMKRLIDASQAGTLGICLKENDLLTIAGEIEYSFYESRWGRMTERERADWKVQFQSVFDKFIELIASGPIPPGEWGFPARSEKIMSALARAGYPVPQPASYENPEYHAKIIEIEEELAAENWDIVDELRSYQHNSLLSATMPQLVKKPRDAKAARAKLIVCLKHQRFSVSDIAKIVATALEDPAVTEKLVRRFDKPDYSKI